MASSFQVVARVFMVTLTLIYVTDAYCGVTQQNEDLFKKLKEVHTLSDQEMIAIRAIFEKSGYMSQGNPAVTKHPMSRNDCRQKLDKLGVKHENPEFEKICGAKYMAPLYNPANEKPEQTKACIDQFEFPNIPCEYPVVWVRANEAQDICTAIGKRMCDAHEWEGACAGALEEADYPFALAKGLADNAAFNKMRYAHNNKYNSKKSWAYGSEYKKGVCAANSTKAPNCDGGNWRHCGSNTYPGGAFPECTSALKVYDIHGNAAEHMNLPLNESQMSSKGSKTLGLTEMKGSWFIWDKFQAHPDWCRWRAPYWHGSKVMVGHSHHNYHLGFRCCKNVEGKGK